MFSIWASLKAQMVKSLLAMQETWVQSLCWEDPWRKKWQFIPVFLAWIIPWTEEGAWQATVLGPTAGNSSAAENKSILSLF